ncbi:MAG TPA: S-methyl-5-thioribose-1-phosphate isomerase, partial [Terriglobales bacterium]
MIKTLEWTDQGVRFIDQTQLPTEETYVLCPDYKSVATAIKDMIVRGAPAIGVTAAMGVALGARDAVANSVAELRPQFDEICRVMRETRPTAVNLFWGIERMRRKFDQLASLPVPELKRGLVEEAQRMYLEDIAACQTMGQNGAVLLPSSGTVLTHCNAGALATCGYGTALGVIRAAVEAGK